MRHEARHRDQHLGLRGQGKPHGLEQLRDLGHEEDQQRHQHAEHDHQGDDRVDHQPARVGYQLVEPLQVLREALEHFRQLAGLLARADQAHEDVVETCGCVREARRQHLAAFHVLGHHVEHVAKARALQGVAHVAQAVDYRDAGPYHLLQVEAEVDQVLARDRAAPAEGAGRGVRPA